MFAVDGGDFLEARTASLEVFSIGNDDITLCQSLDIELQVDGIRLPHIKTSGPKISLIQGFTSLLITEEGFRAFITDVKRFYSNVLWEDIIPSHHNLSKIVSATGSPG